jgi:hypothetical protein
MTIEEIYKRTLYMDVHCDFLYSKQVVNIRHFVGTKYIFLEIYDVTFSWRRKLIKLLFSLETSSAL